MIEALDNEAKVTALGDGEFRVRCTSKNGTDKTKIISELEFKAVGLGTAYKEPYGFISAGLYDYSNGYEEKTFELEKITGKQKVTFIFFPGCNFDFQWFRFER